ncbi:MAG: DUF3516 domain-containing protein, partial [Eggerthellaceae bacterium]|nr:DUF3516 domain-containing protein [Eggerthellaceae bacterium]
LLLRYLSDAYRVLAKTIPDDKIDERLGDLIAWLGLVVRSVDSSLVDEWEHAGEDSEGVALAAPQAADVVVRDRRALTVLVRNALISRVRLASLDRPRDLGEMDADWGMPAPYWKQALDAYYEAHDEVVLDADARSMNYLDLDESGEQTAHVWHVRQTFKDENEDRDFAIDADVDLDATQATGEAVFKNYRVGFIEDLLEA